MRYLDSKQRKIEKLLVIGLWLIIGATGCKLYYATGPLREVTADRDALRATVTALREGDGSCAVTRNGPRVVCWLEDGALRTMPLKAGDVIVNRDCLAKRSRKSCAR